MSQSDNVIFCGIITVWALGFAIWARWLRKKSLRPAPVSSGVVITILGTLFCLYIYSFYPEARSRQKVIDGTICASNLKQIGLGLLQYSVDNNEHFPPAKQWASTIKPYTSFHNNSGLYRCPEAQSPYSYAFNKSLNLLPQPDVSESRSLVVTFESDAKTINANGSSADLCPPRHSGKSNFGFADGHVQSYGPTGPFGYESAGSVNWNPRDAEPQIPPHKRTGAK